MGHFYFVRHGESIWNIENKICGATDIDLTEKGYEQAEQAAEEILKQNLKIDRILSSLLKRAYHTAEIISLRTGIPLQKETRLTEQAFGMYEGTPRDAEEFRIAKTRFIDSYQGGESMFRSVHRIYDLLDEITMQDCSVYLLAAHNGLARIIHSYFHDMTNLEFSDFGIRNCEIRRYDYGVPKPSYRDDFEKRKDEMTGILEELGFKVYDLTHIFLDRTILLSRGQITYLRTGRMYTDGTWFIHVTGVIRENDEPCITLEWTGSEENLILHQMQNDIDGAIPYTCSDEEMTSYFRQLLTKIRQQEKQI